MKHNPLGNVTKTNASGRGRPRGTEPQPCRLLCEDMTLTATGCRGLRGAAYPCKVCREWVWPDTLGVGFLQHRDEKS